MRFLVDGRRVILKRKDLKIIDISYKKKPNYNIFIQKAFLCEYEMFAALSTNQFKHIRWSEKYSS